MTAVASYRRMMRMPARAQVSASCLARDPAYAQLMPWDKWKVVPAATRSSEGVRQVPAPEMREYFATMQADGLVKYAFPEGDVLTEVDFIQLAFAETSHMFLIKDVQGSTLTSPHIVAHALLSGFQGLIAQLHYSAIKEIWGQSVECGREAVRQLFAMRRTALAQGGAGAPLVSTLVGLTPISNRLAVRLLKKVGFQPITTLRDAYWNSEEFHFEDALLSSLEAPPPPSTSTPPSTSPSPTPVT